MKNNEFAELEGRTIVSVECLTQKEMDENCWYGHPAETVVLVLDNGDRWVLTSDPEGNDSGFMYKDYGKPTLRGQYFDMIGLS
jgi:hypothetical protein